MNREGPVISVTTATRSRAHTRARLLEAALGVFAEQGVKRVTVDDLVGAAGFTRGAFYSNFSSIDEVFSAVFEQQSRLMLQTVRERIDAIPESDFSIEALAPVLDGLLPMSRTWFVIQSEFALLALRSEQAREVFVAHHRTFQGEMEALIGDVVARLGRTPVLPLDQLTDTVIGLYLHSLGQESLGTGALDTRVLVESVLPQVLLGLSVPR